MTTWTTIRKWINRVFVTTTVSPSKTLVPLPPIIVGAARDGAGNLLRDESGNVIIPSGTNAILSAIYAVADRLLALNCKVELMSGTVAEIETDIATLVAANTATQEALTTIQQIVANIQPGQGIPQADLDALKAAVAGAQTNATTAHTIATSTATATASST